MQNLKSLLILGALFLTTTNNLLSGLCLRDWIGQFKTGDALAYRSASSVALVQLKSLEPVQWQACQIDLSQFYSQRDWTSSLKSYNDSTNLEAANFWESLLDLPLEPYTPKRTWRPKLEILSKVKGTIDWSVYRAYLPPSISSQGAMKTLTIYVAYGNGLEEAGLPNPWPYWIENHETVHKWVVYLIAVHRHQSQT